MLINNLIQKPTGRRCKQFGAGCDETIYIEPYNPYWQCSKMVLNPSTTCFQIGIQCQPRHFFNITANTCLHLIFSPQNFHNRMQVYRGSSLTVMICQQFLISVSSIHHQSFESAGYFLTSSRCRFGSAAIHVLSTFRIQSFKEICLFF